MAQLGNYQQNWILTHMSPLSKLKLRWQGHLNRVALHWLESNSAKYMKTCISSLYMTQSINNSITNIQNLLSDLLINQMIPHLFAISLTFNRVGLCGKLLVKLIKLLLLPTGSNKPGNNLYQQLQGVGLLLSHLIFLLILSQSTLPLF